MRSIILKIFNDRHVEFDGKNRKMQFFGIFDEFFYNWLNRFEFIIWDKFNKNT